MWNKIIGAVLILAAIFTAIFLVKFMPKYLGVSELERSFSECIGNFKQYKAGGCREYFAGIIERNELSLDASNIVIEAQVLYPSTISAEWDEPIDFFGIWTYWYQPSIEYSGTPPDRD